MDYTYGYLDAPPEFLSPKPGSELYYNVLTYAISEDVYSFRFSKLINALLATLFSMSLLMHLWQGIGAKCWSFMAVMVLGTVGEIIGYVARMMLRGDPSCRSYMLVQLVALSVAPVFLAGGLFVVLKHSIRTFDGRGPRSRISTRTYAWIFGIATSQTVFLQTISTISASCSNTATMGIGVKSSGLLSQLAMLTVLIMMLTTLFSMLRHEKAGLASIPSETSVYFRQLFIPLAITVVAIFIRSFYRTLDLVIGHGHPIIQNELLFINLDSCMCLVVALAMNFYHPGNLLKPDDQGYIELGKVDKDAEPPA